MLQFLYTLTDESNYNKIERIYNDYYDYMIRYAVSRLSACGRQNYMYDAEDVVQNAFVKIAKIIDRIDYSRGEIEVKNYCFGILNSEICDMLDDDEELLDIDEVFYNKSVYDFVGVLEAQDDYEMLVRAVGKLDEKYSTVIYFVFAREMTVSEIAEMMGISQKTVYTRLIRAKRFLLELLEEVHGDE